MDTLEGVVERLTYRNAENDCTVLRLRIIGAAGGEMVTVVGNLPDLKPGARLRQIVRRLKANAPNVARQPVRILLHHLQRVVTAIINAPRP